MEGEWIELPYSVFGLFDKSGMLVATVRKEADNDHLIRANVVGRDYDWRFRTVEQAKTWIDKFQKCNEF